MSNVSIICSNGPIKVSPYFIYTFLGDPTTNYCRKFVGSMVIKLFLEFSSFFLKYPNLKKLLGREKN
jgi:hypothetical protein